MRLHLDKEDMFWVGNIVGIVALLATIVFLAPQKERERREHEQVLQKQKQEALESSMVTVLYAKRDIASDSIIKADDVGLKKIPKDKFGKRMQQRLEKVVGQEAWSNIKKNEIIFDTQIENGPADPDAPGVDGG